MVIIMFYSHIAPRNHASTVLCVRILYAYRYLTFTNGFPRGLENGKKLPKSNLTLKPYRDRNVGIGILRYYNIVCT